MAPTDEPVMDEESVIRLRNAVLRVARRLRTSGDPEGLTATQSSVLATLVREGPMRAGDLADAEALNPTLLSRILGHLEERELVSREPDPEDGRATLARPTPGRQAPGGAAARPPGRPAAGLARGPEPRGTRQPAGRAPRARGAGARGAAGLIRSWASETFSALEAPNFRRFLAGQAVSLVGTWMQTVALGWLVLELTGSGTALGMVVAAQFLPILLLGPYGGLLADRVDKRRLLMATQAILGLTALALGDPGGDRRGRAVDGDRRRRRLRPGDGLRQPARQSFALEMVGPERLRNAVSLQSVMVNVARAVGPAVAGADHRDRRHRDLLPDQRRELRGRPGGARDHGRPQPAAVAARRARAPARCARACGTSGARPGCWCR